MLKESKNPISSSQSILSGTPVFAGTRVPVKSLFDYIEGGQTIDDFLEQFPTVKREQVLKVLERSKSHVLASVA